MRPLAAYGALPRVAPRAEVAGTVGARLARPLRVSVPSRRPVAITARAATVAADVRLWPPLGALGSHVVPGRPTPLPVPALRKAAVAVMGERVGRGTTAEVHVGRVATGAAVPALADLAAGAVTRVRAALTPTVRPQTPQAVAISTVAEAKGAGDTPARRVAPLGRPLAAKPLEVAAPRVPTTKAPDDPAVAALHAGIGVPTIGAPAGVHRQVLRAMAAVLSIPNELGIAVPERVGVGAVHAVAVAVATPVTGGAVAVGATTGVLGLGDGAAAVAHGQVSGRADRAPVAAPVLRAQEEVLAGTPTEGPLLQPTPRAPEVHQTRPRIAALLAEAAAS